jgi:hypothetical protein
MIDFFEIGFKASCFKVSEEHWSNRHNKAQGQVKSTFDEGFICILAPFATSSEIQSSSNQQSLRSVYLLSTLDNSPIMNPTNGKELLFPLIAKFRYIVGENCAVASRKLSQSVSDHISPAMMTD